jgi:hypothetical protein
VPTNGAIVNARRRLGPEPVETIVRAAIQPVADSGTHGAWYRHWRLTAFDGTTFTVPDSEETIVNSGAQDQAEARGRRPILRCKRPA